MGQPPKHPLQTTEKTLTVIEELCGSDGMGVTELAEALGMSKSTAHNHLSTLHEGGYVIRHGQKYKLGMKFLEIGGETRYNLRLFQEAEPEVNALAHESGELVNLLMESQGIGVYLYNAKGEQALDMGTFAGKHQSLHSIALGKAILAHLPHARVEEILDRHGMPTRTKNTITDREEMFRELEAIRNEGTSFDNEEQSIGVRCVAAPIVVDDQVYGSISISGPTSRMQGERFEEGLPEMVRNAANIIELNLKYS